LASHGRSGVPLYLYYAPGQEPQVLPQILTPGRLRETIS
jgi:thiol:disulfide interchange protein DsbD